MATAAQTEANRANAQLSTGPRTAEGKQRSSANRLTHGFRSTAVLLPGDDPAEYEALLDELTTHFEPEDLTEQRYVREMADAEWRLRRVRDWEQRVLETHTLNVLTDDPGLDPLDAQLRAFEKAHSESALAVCVRYATQYQRQYERAYHGLLSTRERASRHRSREATTALQNYLSAPPPMPNVNPASDLPFEPNFESGMAPRKPARSSLPAPLPRSRPKAGAQDFRDVRP